MISLWVRKMARMYMVLHISHWHVTSDFYN